MTLAVEDSNSKLVEVVTVAAVDDEKRFDHSFMQIWMLKFGYKAKFCSDFEHFGQDFEVEVQARF